MNLAFHHARVADARRGGIFGLQSVLDVIDNGVLSVFEVTVNVQRVHGVTNANWKLVCENISSWNERDLCRRAAHLQDSGRRQRLLCPQECDDFTVTVKVHEHLRQQLAICYNCLVSTH